MDANVFISLKSGAVERKERAMRCLDFNNNWMFWKSGEAIKPEQVNLPHDAMLYEKRLPALEGGESSGYFPGGRYTYEKVFLADQNLQGKTVLLEFEGVYQKSTIYLNDEVVGGHIYGYSNFYVDLTDKLLIGKGNRIKVDVNNSQTPNSRWYTGSGIYRNVNLVVGERAHILPDGIRITTKSYQPVVLEVEIERSAEAVRVDAIVQLKVKKDGKEVSTVQNRLACAASNIIYELSISDAELWDAEHPNLYELQVTLSHEGIVLDEAVENFGIRKLSWSAETGLCCNGEMIKLRGCCIHHDNGPLGACEFEETAYRRIQILKESGYNAIRSAHNPISRQLLKACDELGMYIMDEFSDVWKGAKNPYDYSLYFDTEWEKDVTAMVRKDYNHPSVVMYSTGNEVYDIKKTQGAIVNEKIAKLLRSLDGTRPITNGINVLAAASKPKNKPIRLSKTSPEDEVDPCRAGKPSPLVGSKLMNIIITFLPFLQSLIKPEQIENNLKEFIKPLDMVGLNYGMHLTESLHKVNPGRIIVHSETFPRSIGKTWPITLKNKHAVGDFMWTGWDYLGEVGIGVVQYGRQPKRFNKPYPCIGGGVGSVNLAGFIEGQGHYTAVVFGVEKHPYIGVRPLNHAGEKSQMGQWRGTDVVNSWSWTGCEGKMAEIEVFSDEAQIELILNNKSLGKQPVVDYTARFKTIYQPGLLQAIAYNSQGTKVSSSSLSTASDKTVITVCSEKSKISADGNDLAYINLNYSLI